MLEKHGALTAFQILQSHVKHQIAAHNHAPTFAGQKPDIKSRQVA
jgi:hypothetical protein